jgi:hypothetical protein
MKQVHSEWVYNKFSDDFRDWKIQDVRDHVHHYMPHLKRDDITVEFDMSEVNRDFRGTTSTCCVKAFIPDEEPSE